MSVLWQHSAYCLTRSLQRATRARNRPLYASISYKRHISSHFVMSDSEMQAGSSKRTVDDLADDHAESSSDPKRPRLVEDDTGISMEVDATNSGEGEAEVTSERREEDAMGRNGKGKERKKGKSRKADPKGRRARVEEVREPQLDEDGNPIPKAVRLPKRQCALLIGFCGSGYSGMQIQPKGTKTIEGVLFDVLVKIGAISQDNADNPTKVGLARSARTDAGVHAAGNVVSLKMIVTIPGVRDIVARINEELPPEIRLWGFVRTQNSFNARLICESRKYTYFFPSYMLIPPKPGSPFHKKWTEDGNDPTTLLASSFWKNNTSSTKEEDFERKRAWRIGSEQVESLRKFAARYEGTHNFHNFTVGREFTDRSNMRFMKKLEVMDPVVYGDTEWIAVQLHGQSFMLHQRKMMTILVLGARMGTSTRLISELYGQRSIFVPKMPALGLLLEEPLFESYNQRMSVINEKFKPTDPDYRPLIDFDQYRDKMNAFKEEFIYKTMRGVEDRDGLFDAWLRVVDAYSGNDLLYLGQSGAVPDAAVIIQGARRDNPFKEKRIFDTTSFTAQSEIKRKLEEDDDIEIEDEAPVGKRQLEETEG